MGSADSGPLESATRQQETSQCVQETTVRTAWLINGRDENAHAPEWVKAPVAAVRATQPQSWAPGITPWLQPPKGGKIIYTGDGR